METIDVERRASPLRSSPAVGAFPEAASRRTLPHFDLLKIPWLRSLLVSRWPQLVVRAFTLAGLVFTILAGLFGSAVGSHNFAIIFVWIAWWTALKLVFIPAGGRSWCSVCPIPMPGEWAQQGGVLRRKGLRRGLGLAWPQKLRGYWLQGGGFLAIGLFSAVTLTVPWITAWVLLALVILAAVLGLVFERRAFCTYLCPIGGFTGLYARFAPLELRVLDRTVCKAHEEKTCYQECPWGIYPVALRDNAACGLCMECVRICPQDNLALNLRSFGEDLFASRPASRRLDEAFLALVMLGSALAFSAVFTGPWGWLKSAAFEIGSPAWLDYSLGFLVLNLGVLPGLYALAVRAGQGRTARDFRRALAQHALPLLPLGLFAWIAFTVSFALPKLSTVFAVLSDPLGWGWDLFGAAGSRLDMNVSAFSPVLQAALVLLGLLFAGKTAREQRLDRAGWRSYLPLMVFCTAYALGLLWLLIG